MSTEDRSKMSVMLTSSDMPESVRFYRDLLGFDMKESWPDENEPKWANMVLDGQSVMLGAAMDPEQASEACQGDPVAEKYLRQAAEDYRSNKAGVGVLVYLMVPDIDAYHAQIKQAGVAVGGEPTTQF